MARREHRGEVPVRSEPLRPITGLSVTPLLGVLIVLVLGYLATLAPPQPTLDVRVPVPVAIQDMPYQSQMCDNQIVLTVRRDGQFDVNLQLVPRDILVFRLREIYRQRSCSVIYITADPDVRYGKVADFVDAAKGAGIRHVVMILPQDYADLRAEVPR